MHRLWQRRLQLRQQMLNAVHHLDRVRARLSLNIENHRRRRVVPRGQLIILNPIHNVRDLRKHHWRTIAICHHHRLVVVAAHQLVVGVDRVVLRWPVEVALRRVEAVRRQRIAQVFKVDPVGRKRRRIRLDAHRRLLPTRDAHQTYARDLRDLRREPCIR